MAKYLGGIKDPDIEVVGISKAFLSADFYVDHYNYNSKDFKIESYSICDSIIRYEEITSQKNSSSSYSLTW